MSDNDRILNCLATVLGQDSELLFKPGSEGYDESNSSYFSALVSALKPSFILRPKTIEQVREIIRALRPLVLQGSCSIAIRGTEHTPFAGSANIQDGVTIDLRNFKGIVLNTEESTVKIGIRRVGKVRLTTAGARVNNVGVGGFILGGALSMISSRRGFSYDSVTEFQVVLASGELVRVSADEHPDLFIALKGGLNNFGVVTSATMKTYNSGDVWGGVVYYQPEAFTDLFHRACDFARDESDEEVHVMCSAGYGFGHTALTCVMYRTQGQVNPPLLQRFTSAQPQIEQMSSLRTSTTLVFIEELAKFSSAGRRQYWASITVKPDFDLIQTFYDTWQLVLTKVKDAEGFTFSFGFKPLTKSLLKHSQEAGENAMGISPADGPLFIVLTNPVWTNPADDNRIFAAIEEFLIELREIACERGLLYRYIFVNYAYWKDDVMAGYGKDSIERMKAVSAKYDPEGLFQKGVPGGFKLAL
ncbi:bifunctional solanapyrone synthase [Rhypophila sp. PSN 637]